MKASEVIERIKELAEVIGGDPEVVIGPIDENEYEAAVFESQFVHKCGSMYRDLKDGNTEQVIKAW